MSPTWETTTDLDAYQDEMGVHHEQPTGTSWASSDTVEAGYPTYDPNGTALEAYWPFDAVSGGLTDVSGNGNDAITTNGVSEATGVFNNNAGDFDGTDDYIEVPTGILSATGDWTIEFWVNPDDKDQVRVVHPREDVGTIIALNDSGTTTGNPKTLDVYIGGGWRTDQLTVPVGSWTYVAVRYNDTDNYLRTYKNGVEQTWVTAGDTSTSSDSGNWLGSDRDGSTELYDGGLCEVRWFSRLRSEDEINDAYNTPL